MPSNNSVNWLIAAFDGEALEAKQTSRRSAFAQAMLPQAASKRRLRDAFIAEWGKPLVRPVRLEEV